MIPRPDPSKFAATQGNGRTSTPLGVLFAVVFLSAQMMAQKPDLPPLVRLSSCLVATVAFVCFFWEAERRIMRGLDELQQRIRLEAYAIAFPFSLALIMLLVLLSKGGFLASHLDCYPFAVVMPYLVALIWSRRRYR